MPREVDALVSLRRPTPRDVAQRMIEAGVDLRTIRELLLRVAGTADEPAELSAILRRLSGRHALRQIPAK